MDEKAKANSATTISEVLESEEEEHVGDKELTQELLDQYLPAVKEHFKKLGKNMELAILEQSAKVSEGKIYLEIAGHVQEELGQKMTPELIRIIRELTGVGKLHIKFEIKEELEAEQNRLYTSTDKLNYLMSKHAALAEFQRRFGLVTDF